MDTVRLLRQTAPEAAQLRNRSGHTPLQTAIAHWLCAEALCLVAEGTLQPEAELLLSLARSTAGMHSRHLYYQQYQMALVATALWARTGSDPHVWDTALRVADGPEIGLTTSPQLVLLLAALLRDSDAAAGRRVRFLPERDRSRLSCFALCLSRIERGLSAPLPTAIVRRLLVQAAEQHAQVRPRRAVMRFPPPATDMTRYVLVQALYTLAGIALASWMATILFDVSFTACMACWVVLFAILYVPVYMALRSMQI